MQRVRPCPRGALGGTARYGTARYGTAQPRPPQAALSPRPGPARPAGRRRGPQAPAVPFLPPASLGPLGTFSRKLLELVVFLQEPQVHRLLFFRHARPRCPPTLTGWRHGAARPPLRLRLSAARPPLSTASRHLPRRSHSASLTAPPHSGTRGASPRPASVERLGAPRVATLKRDPRCSFQPHSTLNARPRCTISLCFCLGCENRENSSFVNQCMESRH